MTNVVKSQTSTYTNFPRGECDNLIKCFRSQTCKGRGSDITMHERNLKITWKGAYRVCDHGRTSFVLRWNDCS